MGDRGVLWGGVITHAILGDALSVLLLSRHGTRVEGGIVRDLVRFGLPLVIMQVATFVATFGDRYFLNRAGTTADVGLYGLAYQFGFLVATIGYAPFAQVWEPQRFAIAKRADRESIFADVFVYLNVMLISAALGIALFAGDALRVIATPDFHAAAVFVPLLTAAYVLQSWGLFLNLGMYITERTEYFTAANWVAAIVAMGGFLWLIPRWVVWGAVVTTLVSKAVLCGLVYVFSQRLWRVAYRWKRVVQIAGLAIGAGVLAELLPPLRFWMSVSVHAVLFSMYAALVWMLVLTGHERRVVSGGLRSRLPLLTQTT
jgi:O-antigen/teichoic acid export membrane protein